MHQSPCHGTQSGRLVHQSPHLAASAGAPRAARPSPALPPPPRLPRSRRSLPAGRAGPASASACCRGRPAAARRGQCRRGRSRQRRQPPLPPPRSMPAPRSQPTGPMDCRRDHAGPGPRSWRPAGWLGGRPSWASLIEPRFGSNAPSARRRRRSPASGSRRNIPNAPAAIETRIRFTALLPQLQIYQS